MQCVCLLLRAEAEELDSPTLKSGHPCKISSLHDTTACRTAYLLGKLCWSSCGKRYLLVWCKYLAVFRCNILLRLPKIFSARLLFLLICFTTLWTYSQDNETELLHTSFFCAFAKLWKSTLSFVTSVRQPVSQSVCLSVCLSVGRSVGRSVGQRIYAEFKSAFSYLYRYSVCVRPNYCGLLWSRTHSKGWGWSLLL
jgi:hypothetical protein